MLKYIYRTIILIVIFVGAIFYFSRDIKEVVFNQDNTTVMEDATFPLVTIKTNERVINMLHGYSSNISADKIREGVAPLGTDQTFEVLFKNEKQKVKKLNYEVRELVDNKLIESSSVSVFEDSGENKSAKIKLNATLTTGKEYAVKIALINSKSQKLYYFQRVKVFGEAHIKENIDFVMDFHKAIMDKKTAPTMELYLSNPTKLSTTPTLSYVTMENSNMDMISWGTLKPKVVSEVVPTIKEIYQSMASIELNYYIEAKVGDNVERYHVIEFYRVHYDTDRMHLYNYERRMESVFDVGMADVSKSRLKLGVTNNTQISYMPSVDKNKIAFVRDGSLWMYNLSDNEITKVFSFQQKQSDYVRDLYDQHDIRILDMDAEGNMDFLVYGYMNRGQYEGHVGILLYRFIKAENRVEERVYIPVEESYQTLKENIGELSYLNAKDMFYFNIYNTIYAYNMTTGHLTEIAENIDHNQVVILPEGNRIAWQENPDLKASTKINIMNLDSGEKQTITAPEGYNIRLLDKIDTNIVYGFIKNNDIISMVDGTILAPIDSVEIADVNKTVLKTYKKSGYYVTGVSVKDNILELRRIKKSEGGSGYESAPSDFIMNQVKAGTSLLGISTKSNDKGLIECYMTLPKEFKMKQKPKVVSTVNTVINQDSTLRLTQVEQKNLYYYPYVTGGIDGSYELAADAISKARDEVGVVFSSDNQLVWERGVQAMVGDNTITRIVDMNWSSTSSKSVESCIKLMLEYQGITLTMDQLDTQQSSAYEVLRTHSKLMPIRLTGTTLSDVLYYVSKERPVLAMKDSSHAVLIYGYDSLNIKVIDPADGGAKKIGMNDAKQMFESAGNIFISYLE